MSDRIAVMNRGRYEQLGDPESLYERPRTRFVAGFLGVSNLLPGTVVDRGAEQATVRLADDTHVRVPSSAIDGSASVDLGVRPEKVRMHDDGAAPPSGHNRLTGVVRDASYLGVSTSYIVETGDGTRIMVYEQNAERATKSQLRARGDHVQLTWSPDHTFVINRPGESTDTASAGAARSHQGGNS